MSISNTEKTVKDIRRNTRRKFSAEEKIRIVLDGLRVAILGLPHRVDLGQRRSIS